MKEVFLSARDLSIGYPKSRKQDETALHKNFNFELYTGELTCLLGENGAGKSTLLRTIAGLQAPLSGEVFIRSKNLKKYSEQELSTLLGLVLTDKTTAGGFTVSELVGLGRYPYTGFFGKLSSKDIQIVEQAMEDVGISHKSKSYVAELSDGERQKVMIAKAIAQECPLIVLDEPTAFLDVVNRIEIMNLLHDLATTKGKTILLSTHDVELALSLADRLWLLAKNEGLITGITEDIILSNTINEYIGNSEISFDKQSGRFVSKQKTEKRVNLIASADVLMWAKNFFMRNGYSVADNEDCNFIVNIISPTNIEVHNKDQVATLNSFEQLYLWLKN